MNIAFISDQFYPRTSADSEQIINSLAALGKLSDVTLLSAKYANQAAATTSEIQDYYGVECTFKLDFISHLFPGIRGLEKIFFALKSAFFARNKTFDLVYTRNIPVVISTILLTNLPIVFESYRPWPSRNWLSRWFFKKIESQKRFLGVVLHSNFAGKSFKEVGFKDERLLLAHNAFDFSAIEESNSDEVREKFELPTDQLITTYSGRVNESKGLLQMLELASSFKEEFFLIIGSEKRGVIEEKAEDLENVKVLSWQDKKTVFSLLQASDILYLPPTLKSRDVSKNTVLPLKTFIYKASGRSIFGPVSEDVCEVLEHDVNAYLVEPDNWEEEKKGFQVLVKDEKLRARLGEKSKEEMKSLSWDSRAKDILSFINNQKKG